MDLLGKLGIDVRLLVAQIINFLVLLFVLYKFAYKPVLKMLSERNQKIEKGLKDAEESRLKLEESSKKQEEILAEARREAQQVLKQVQKQAEAQRNELAQKANAEAEKIIKKAQIQIKEEKNKMLAQVRREIGQLVVYATEKIISEKISEERDKTLIERTIDTFNKK